MRPITICLINQKGGCGKSSICFHMAGHFAQTGRRESARARLASESRFGAVAVAQEKKKTRRGG